MVLDVTRTVLNQLTDTLLLLSEKEYTSPSKNLSKATIGQHVRHIIELFQCLLTGYESGNINYDDRKRDRQIETERIFAVETILSISSSLSKENKSLQLTASFGEDPCIQIETNYSRELVYNLEHTIHHMALIKVGILELTSHQLQESFGVAPSTIQYRKACAQ